MRIIGRMWTISIFRFSVNMQMHQIETGGKEFLTTLLDGTTPEAGDLEANSCRRSVNPQIKNLNRII